MGRGATSKPLKFFKLGRRRRAKTKPVEDGDFLVPSAEGPSLIIPRSEQELATKTWLAALEQSGEALKSESRG